MAAERAEGPEVIVDYALRDLWNAIRDLKTYREANYTADQVLSNHEMLSTCAAMLDGLASDVHLSVHKAAAE